MKTRHRRLESRAETLLNGSDPTVEQLDEALTDCAAEALSLEAEFARAERELRELERQAGERQGLVTELDEVLALQDRITGQVTALSGLMERLRARRQQLVTRPTNASG